MKKLAYLASALLVAGSVISGCGQQAAADTKAQQEIVGSDSSVGVDYVRQLVAADNRTGRTLMWRAKSAAEYTVEYRLKGQQESASVKAEDTSFKDRDANWTQYTARLRGLQPGKTYEYRINTVQNKGSWHTLQTDDGSAFTAIVFPDSQSADYSGWQQLARDAAKRHADASMYINMGDLVDNGQSASQWRAWFGSVEPFSDAIPLAPLLGNHEAYSLDWKEVEPVSYTHLFDVPQNGRKEYRNQFYSFDYGDVHFTVLDTNFPEMKQYQPQLLADQLPWLEKDLAASKAKWKVVLMHRDIFLYGFGPESGRAQTKTHFLDFSYQLMPVFEKYNVDAVLTAHLHTYRRRVPLRDFKPNPQGITYILTGIAGDVRYPKLWGDFEWDAGRAPQPETANYMTMRSDDKGLTLKAFLPDGREFDSVILTK